MEKILNQILEKLTALEEGQRKLQVGQETLEEGQKKLQGGQETLEGGQAAIAKEVSEINRKVSVIFDQTANLTEFTTATTDSLERIETELGAVEKVTAKNCFDIAHLKAIK